MQVEGSTPLNDTVLAIYSHFDEALRKRNKGLVTVIAYSEAIVAGIGRKPFMVIDFFDECLHISAEMPIPASKPTTGPYCLNLHQHRSKDSIKRKELVEGFYQDNQGIKNPKGKLVPEIAFEYARPGSLHAAEYYAHKIISVVRRKVRLVNQRDGDTVLLKDQFDCTNLIDFVTGEWNKNKPRFLRNQV
jgi:hypothetical protein